MRMIPVKGQCKRSAMSANKHKNERKNSLSTSDFPFLYRLYR